MTRLQKKCLVATAGSHLLVIVALLCSAFITSKPKPDDTQLLTVIPSTLIDAAASSGAKAAEPPKQTPIVKPPEPPPPQPKPEPVVPPPPQPKPEPVKQPEPEPVKEPEKINPEALKPVAKVEKTTKPPKREIKIDLTKVVVRKTPKVEDNSEAEAQAEAKEQKRIRDARTKAFASAATNIRANSSSLTSVEMPGPGSVSYANYGAAVKSIYDAAWKAPEDMAGADANVRVSISISRDGRVISARIVSRSGDARVDASVQRALDRVDTVPPFPDGAKERERTFFINFNPQARRMTG